MIYFDNNATTALHPEVLKEMLPFLTSQQGNPASNQYIWQKSPYCLRGSERESSSFS